MVRQLVLGFPKVICLEWEGLSLPVLRRTEAVSAVPEEPVRIGAPCLGAAIWGSANCVVKNAFVDNVASCL